MAWRSTRCALLLAALGLCSGAIAGQAGRPLDPQDLERLQEVLDREDMHPTGGSALMGVEEGDNGFRDRTPALLKADVNRRELVDDELYERRLALFEGRVFASPVRADGGRKKTSAKLERKVVDEAFGDARSKALPIALGTVVLLVFGLRVLR